MMVVDGVYVVYTQIDSLLIGAFLTVASVGIWQAPVKLTNVLIYPGQAIASAVAPRVIAVEEAGRFEAAIRVLIALMAAVTVVTTVWSVPIISLLLGPRFEKSSEVLRVLAPFVFLSGLGPLLTIGMNYLGAARRRVKIAAATLLVNLVLDLILIPSIGVIGAAIGSDVAVTIYVGAHFAFCRQALALTWRPIVGTLARSTLAAAPMTAVLLVFGTGKLSLAAILAGGALGMVAFCAVLVVTGEATPAQLRAVLAARRLATGRRPTGSADPD
jgi:O-antigen/teichoic acid export membrane protein